MSDQTFAREQPAGRGRVIKSGQAVGLRLAFSPLEQVASGDLPPSVSQWVEAPPVFPGGAPAAGETVRPVPAAQVSPAPVVPTRPSLSAQAQEAEARALAMERRASAVLAEAEETAAGMLCEAETRVQAMLTRAAEAAGHIETEAREAGRAAGREEGLAAGLEEARAEATALLGNARAEADHTRAEARRVAERIHAEALEERALLLETAKEQLLDLAFAMARQILKSELALRPEAMVPMVEAALAKMKGEEEPQVRVSPAVLALLEEQRGWLLAAVPGARRLEISPDPGLEPGDFVVQGGQGFVDGRVERQLKVLTEEVRSEEG